MRRLTWSVKRMDSTNPKRRPAVAFTLFIYIYTGCVDNGMGSWMLVDDAGNSSTVFKTRNGQLRKVLAMMGDNAGCPTFCAGTIGPSVKHQQQLFA